MMTIFHNILLAVLVLLAVASGLAKIMLMPQEVDVFGQYGFSNPLLATFGVLQVMGGLLLLIPTKRMAGALLIATTFFVSGVVLLLSGSTTLAVITMVFVVLACMVASHSSMKNKPN